MHASRNPRSASRLRRLAKSGWLERDLVATALSLWCRAHFRTWWSLFVFWWSKVDLTAAKDRSDFLNRPDDPPYWIDRRVQGQLMQQADAQTRGDRGWRDRRSRSHDRTRTSRHRSRSCHRRRSRHRSRSRRAAPSHGASGNPLVAMGPQPPKQNHHRYFHQLQCSKLQCPVTHQLVHHCLVIPLLGNGANGDCWDCWLHLISLHIEHVALLLPCWRTSLP